MNKISTKKRSVKVSTQNEKLPVEAQFEPSQNVIDNILNYSKALSIKKSTTIGNIEMILN